MIGIPWHLKWEGGQRKSTTAAPQGAWGEGGGCQERATEEERKRWSDLCFFIGGLLGLQGSLFPWVSKVMWNKKCTLFQNPGQKLDLQQIRSALSLRKHCMRWPWDANLFIRATHLPSPDTVNVDFLRSVASNCNFSQNVVSKSH